MQRKILALLVQAGLAVLAGLAASACVAPGEGGVSVSSKPGWGRVWSAQEERMTVRAVPAAASPSLPVTRLGRPGWGRL